MDVFIFKKKIKLVFLILVSFVIFFGVLRYAYAECTVGSSACCGCNTRCNSDYGSCDVPTSGGACTDGCTPTPTTLPQNQATNTPRPTTPPGQPTNTPPPAATATPNPACVSNPGSFTYGGINCTTANDCPNGGNSTKSCEGGQCIYRGNLKACYDSGCPRFWVPDGWSCYSDNYITEPDVTINPLTLSVTFSNIRWNFIENSYEFPEDRESVEIGSSPDSLDQAHGCEETWVGTQPWSCTSPNSGNGPATAMNGFNLATSNQICVRARLITFRYLEGGGRVKHLDITSRVFCYPKPIPSPTPTPTPTKTPTPTPTLARPSPFTAMCTGPYGPVELVWTDTNTTENGYKLARKVNSDPFVLNYKVYGPNVIGDFDYNVSYGNTYGYNVRACYGNNCQVEGPYAGQVNLTCPPPTNTPTPIPSSTNTPTPILLNPPTNLQATCSLGNTNKISLTWNDNSNNEDGFEIIRNSVFQSRVGANVNSYDDNQINLNTVYYYNVYAFKVDNNGH